MELSDKTILELQDLPDDPLQLERLAFLLHESSGEALASAVHLARQQVRAKAEEMFGQM